MQSPELSGLPVRCDSWALARPAASRSRGTRKTTQPAVEIALCHRNQCGPFERFPPIESLPAAAAEAPAPVASGTSGFWGYVLLGTAGAATIALLVFSATGRDSREQTVWIYDGLK